MQSRRKILRLGMLCGGYSLTGGKLMAADTPDLDSYQKSAERIRPLFEKKKPPGPMDWLANQKESGQTFIEFLIARPERRSAERSKLYLQPLGEFTAGENAVLKTLREFMGLFFGTEVVMRDRISLRVIPKSATRDSQIPGVKQILSTYVLDKVLLPARPKDAVAVLAITISDLWPGEGWNFVFGQASLEERVGVWSTRRFGDPAKEPVRFLRRVLQVAVHETGHMFGIRHCTAYECCMNGSNNLDESDRAPLVYCCECDPKLWWSCNLKPAERAKALAGFSRKHSLDAEAAQWSRIARLLAAD